MLLFFRFGRLFALLRYNLTRKVYACYDIILFYFISFIRPTLFWCELLSFFAFASSVLFLGPSFTLLISAVVLISCIHTHSLTYAHLFRSTICRPIEANTHTHTHTGHASHVCRRYTSPVGFLTEPIDLGRLYFDFIACRCVYDVFIWRMRVCVSTTINTLIRSLFHFIFAYL